MSKRPRSSDWDAKKGGFKRQRMMSLSQQQKKEVDVEVKKVLARKTDYKITDRVLTYTSVDYSGATYSLFASLVRGTLGKDNFDGDSIIPKWVRVRYAVHTSATSVESFNMVRVIILQSRLLGTPTVTEVLDGTSLIATGQAPIMQRLEERMKDYKILYDKTHTLNNSGIPIEFVDVFIPGKRLTAVEFTSTGTLSVTRGDISVLVLSDDALTDFPDFAMAARCKFSD